jgi:hypothetical protein
MFDDVLEDSSLTRKIGTASGRAEERVRGVLRSREFPA